MAKGKKDSSALPALTSDRLPTAKTAHDHDWQGVAGAFSHFVWVASSSAANPAQLIEAATKLIGALHASQDQQMQVLKVIQEDAELLRTAAFKTAMISLQDAALVGPTSDRYTGLLEEAARELKDAWATCASLEEEFYVAFLLGNTWLLLNERALASEWVRRSYETGHDLVTELASRADDTRLMEHKSSSALATMTGAVLPVVGVGMMMKRHAKKSKAKDAKGALEAVIPWYNTAVSCLNALTEGDPVPLVEIGRKHRHLVLDPAEEKS